MTTGYHLIDNPNPNAPERGDGRYWGWPTMSETPRAIVLHTTESLADIDGPDSGAENVARWFATNTTAASYHTLVDSDTTVRCLPAGLDGTTVHTAFHAYGQNSRTLGLSLAMRADSWSTVPQAWASKIINRAVNEAAAWCAQWGIPAVRITLAELDAGSKGILAHADTSPTDRSDPGAGFPWGMFLRLVAAQLDLGGATIDPSNPFGDDLNEEQHNWLREVHFWLAQGYVPGATVAAMRPDIDALAGKIDAIAGTTTDLTKVPTTALVAELGRRASA
jgi:hypothetical protein